jgi:hypothetical protein
LGSPHFRARACFHARVRENSRSSRSPEQFAQVHPLVLKILFRVPSLSLPPAPFREQAYCQGSVPLRDVTGCVHSSRGFPSPRYVPSAGVLNLSTAFSASRLHGPISSRSRLQGLSLVQGVTFSSQRSFPHRDGLPPCRCSTAARQDESRDHDRRPRLRGLDPRRSSRPKGR